MEPHSYRLLVLLMLVVLGGCGPEGADTQSDAAADDRSFRWKLVTAWPPNLPVTHEAVVQFAADVELMSRGQLQIRVFAGGELVPSLQAFDAVSQGTVEMGHTASYYWAGKVPAAQYMTAVPFGMTARGMWAWMYGADGLEIWRELYEPFDLVPFPMGNTGTQMGGWFKKRIETAADLEGLKMRIPGLGGKVLDAAGGNPILLAGGEVYTALERGTIDATEWVGPLHDVRMGLDRAARYYYYPGWQEPSTQLELIINKQAWESLPPHLQKIVESAATAAGVYLYSRMEVENAKSYQALKESDHVEILEFPDDVLAALYASTRVALEAEGAGDETFKKTGERYNEFRRLFDEWDAITEAALRRFYEGRNVN